MSVFKSSVVVSFLTLVSRVFGFVRDILVASVLGTSFLADIFNVVFRLPNFFRRLFAEGAFNAAFVPMISHKLVGENGFKEARKFANSVFTILFAFLFILVLLMEIYMPSFIKLFAPGFKANQEQFDLTVFLSRITMPYLLFISVVSFHSALLNSLGFFVASSAISVLLNFTLIASILFLDGITPTAAHSLSIGIFASGVIQFLVMRNVIKKEKMLPRFVKPQINDDVKQMFRNMLPAIFGSGIVQINLWIDTIFASLIVGAVSSLAYADRIMQLPLALIGTAIGTVMLPTISKEIRQQNFKQANAFQNRAIEAAALFAVPASFALIFIAKPVVSILFERGEFNASDSVKTASALAAFSLGLPAFIASKLLVPNFFANYDTKTPVKVSMICLVCNVLLCIFLTPLFEHVGIALATTISGWVGAASLLLFLVRKKHFKMELKCKMRLLKITVAAALMSVYLIIFQDLILGELKSFTMLFILILTSMLVYAVFIYLFKVFQIAEIKQIFKRKID